jgi:hypothetical protein
LRHNRWLQVLTVALLLAGAAAPADAATTEEITKKFGECRAKLGKLYLGVELTKKDQLKCMKSKNAAGARDVLKSGEASCRESGRPLLGAFDNKGNLSWICGKK